MFGFYSSQDIPSSPFVIATVIFVALSAMFSGCYTVRQGTTMLGYLGRAIPLEELPEKGNPYRIDENQRFVERVADIRNFAINELGLKESKNYTTYVELDRGYLAAVVYATAKDSFTRHEWWFPVIGKVPYKGFFDADDAKRERSKLERKGLDVWIRGVDAFSTLGWFQDPLYSYMKQYPVQELADMIIHELFHATVYINSHSQFNESLAEFVGSEGSRLYMEKFRTDTDTDIDNPQEEISEDFMSGNAEDFVFVPLELGPTEFMSDKNYNEAARADHAAFLIFVRGLISELNTIYENDNLSTDEKLRLKAEIIAASQENFRESYDQNYKTGNYKDFPTLPINNAYLDLYRLYYEDDNWFKEAYVKSGSNLREYINAAKTLNTINIGRKTDLYSVFMEALERE